MVYLAINDAGYLHNVIIYELVQENENLLEQNLTTEELCELVIPKLEKYGYHISVNDKQQITNEVKTLVPANDVLSEPNRFISYVRAVRPDLIDEMNVLEDYIANVAVLPDEKVFEYTKGYWNIVSDAKIPQEDKDVLSNIIAVGGNSALLWKPVKTSKE